MLPDSYVIFICDFDPMGDKLYWYTYDNTCRENGKPDENGVTTMLLSTKGKNREQVPESLSALMDYIGNPDEKSSVTKDSFILALKDKVDAIKKERIWEAKFVLFEEMMDDAREEGKEEGKAEERTRFNQLINQLAESNRVGDILKSAVDLKFQEQLFQEFGL